MDRQVLQDRILNNLSFVPNPGQMALIQALSRFIEEQSPGDVFVLNGYAGTGKTSVVGALVKAMKSLKRNTVVLAPTGRAAKVASNFSLGEATTIHKRLFRGNSADPNNTNFFLSENRDRDTLFIIDEASMITDGLNLSSSLLLQLIRHVYSGDGCNMILVGDLAQLPPVGQNSSHAMNPERLRGIGLNPISFSLTEPARHSLESGILFNATSIRNSLLNEAPVEDFKIFQSGFSDVEIISSGDFTDYLSSSYNRVGKDETIVITRSNYRANNINATIRRYLLDAESPLINGERIVISKNDYFWSKQNKLNNFIANGEIAHVMEVGKKTKAYGRWFADALLKVPGIETPLETKIILRSLVAEGPTISKEEMERFYNLVLASAEGELSEKIKAAMLSPYYNALQVKYGYSITCHKAQGGQWKHVYVDMGGMNSDLPAKEFYRWLYTAVTRATEKVFFINPPFEIE